MWWHEEPVEIQEIVEEMDDGCLRFDEDRGHYILALFLAFLFYAIFLVFIFLELPIALSEQPSLIPHGNALLDHLPRRALPARVVSLPVPQGATAPRPSRAKKTITPSGAPIPPIAPTFPVAPATAALPSTPAPTTSVAPSTDQSPSGPVAPVGETMPVSEPTGPLTIFPVPQNNARHGGIEAHPTNLPPTTELPLPSRRGRASWSKAAALPTKQKDTTVAGSAIPPSYSYQATRGETEAFSQLEEISSQQISRFPACDGEEGGEPTYGSPIGSKSQVSAKYVARNMEFELFATRLVHNICDASHQQPLHVTHTSIALHVITVSVTVARDRRITKIAFLQPSPHQMINHYLEGILQTTTAPQLPASWHDEELTMPLRIHIRAVPETAEIWLIPIEGV